MNAFWIDSPGRTERVFKIDRAGGRFRGLSRPVSLTHYHKWKVEKYGTKNLGSLNNKKCVLYIRVFYSVFFELKLAIKVAVKILTKKHVFEGYRL